jgi:hypothetical protein
MNCRISEFYQKYSGFCIDIFYIHDNPSPSNSVQDIYDKLSEFEGTRSRSLELKKVNSLRSMLSLAELLADPTQRSTIPRCHYFDF